MQVPLRSVSYIVLTGGPCAGKSTAIAVARQYLEDRGMKVVVASETATELITSGFSPTHGWRDSIRFQSYLLRFLLSKEDLYAEMLRAQETSKPLVVLCDRGALDAVAYVGKSMFVHVARLQHTTIPQLLEMYSAVIHMVTAADGAEAFYITENNSARFETPAQARALDARTLNAWAGHQHLTIVNNATNFDRKVVRVLTALTRTLHMPTPLEKERKFQFLNWNESFLPVDAVKIEIVQTYLKKGESGEERRVRMRTLDGSYSYYYTEKTETGEKGIREEKERQISAEEYTVQLREMDPMTESILKTRYCFRYGGHMLEVDVYQKPVSDLVIVGVEVGEMSDSISFPDEWKLREVTGELEYKNRSIAEGSLG